MFDERTMYYFSMTSYEITMYLSISERNYILPKYLAMFTKKSLYNILDTFFKEGENNEKFDSHPRHPSALPAYLLVHNSWYYGCDLFFSLMLLLLAIVEKPSVENFEFPIGLHGTLELLALGVIGIELALKLRWIGWKTILAHKRTMIKVRSNFN